VIALSLAEIAAAAGGSVHAATPPCRDASADASPDAPLVPEAVLVPDAVLVDGPVVTDSRAAGPGGLYVARRGEHADGHDYVPDAARAGAVAVLGEHPVALLPAVVVDDVQTAFGRVARRVLDGATAARAARGERLTVVGVTGSSGKTSTKDLLAHVLASAGETVAPVESLNGEIGVPLTVCRVGTSTRFLVAEMGARGIGHVAYLTGIAPPDIGVVLNVGRAHVGEFGGTDNIARAKGELVEALTVDGLAVLNADDPAVLAMAARTRARVVTTGEALGADVRAGSIVLDDAGRPTFTVHASGGAVSVQLGLHGRHHVANALAVVAVALEVGMPLADIAAALATARPASRWRMEVSERADGVTVVNDAYNANPDSMAAALHALRAMGRPQGRAARRTWAVLGQMLELGEAAVAEHAGVGALAAQLGVDRLLAVGPGAAAIADGAEAAGMPPAHLARVPDADAAYELLVRDTHPGDVVLFKSSRDAGLRWLGEKFAQREVGS
jgi:UDP-N-acetylmuramoyl-tripeptide--D-alanyl-D-alanine ligase